MKQLFPTLLLLAASAFPSVAANLYRAGTFIVDDVNGTQFDLPFNVLNSQLSNGFTAGNNSENTFAQADLRTGTIRVSNSGSLGTGYGRFDVNASAILADTFIASGPLTGANFLTSLTLTGAYSSSSTGAGTYSNASFLLVSFFSDGFFDDAPGSRIIQETIYGIGIGARDPSAPGDIFGGYYSSFPASIPISIPFNLLGPRFQVRVQLTTNALGDTTGGVNGIGSVSWNQNLANTLVAQFSASNGVTLRSEGGIAGTAQAVPEPATWAIAAAGLSLLVLRRRK